MIAISLFACLLAGCDTKSMSFGKKEPDFKPEYTEYTILLARYKGPAHVRLASGAKRELKSQGWKDVFVVHEHEFSAVYSGHYDETRQASRDLKKAKNFTLANGRKPFDKAIVVSVPGTHDKGPEKWNFKNAVGRYSLLVAIFYDVPQQNYFGRRLRAVELCKKLRKQGEEAYFYHGPNKSGVTIGTFGPNAIKTQVMKVKHPETGQYFEQDRKYINDPRLRALRNKYPELLICGNTEITKKMVMKNGKAVVEKEVQQSYPIGIPNWKEKLGKTKRKRTNKSRRRPVDQTNYIGYP